MFENMRRKYEERAEQVAEAFEDIGDEAGKIFMQEAVKRTNRKKLVKTGNYRRSWRAETKKAGKDTVVECINEAEYASHLEYGHRIVTSSGVDTGRKTQAYLVGHDSVKTTLNKIKPVVSDIIGGILEK